MVVTERIPTVPITEIEQSAFCQTDDELRSKSLEEEFEVGVRWQKLPVSYMRLQPDEGVHLQFEVKVPDKGMTMQSVDMDFHYESAFADQAIPDAYERLLQNALEGDPSLFIRSDHIEHAWSIVEPLLQAWESPGAPRAHTYELGSHGPVAADDMLAQDGRRWLEMSHGHKSRTSAGTTR